jgi:hypothetical protein
MCRSKRNAASFWASALALANTVEFLDGVDHLLPEFDRSLLTTTEALWRIRRLRESMNASNGQLRELAQGDETPPSDLGGPCLP